MKRIAFALLSAVGLSLTGGASAETPAKAPPAGMSWEPNDVWKNVKPTIPADFWPAPPPEEKKPEGEKKKSDGKKGGAKKKQQPPQ